LLQWFSCGGSCQHGLLSTPSVTLSRETRLFLPLVKFFHRHLPWFNLPAAALLALLQRTPVVRVAATVEQLIIASPVGQILRSTITAVASLGAVHALAGATQLRVTSPTATAVTTPGASGSLAVSGTVGTPISGVAFALTGAVTPVQSYQVTALPPGLSVPGATATGIVNAFTGVISGTPTTVGTFQTRINAWEFPNATGDRFGPVTVVYTIVAGAPVAPAFTAHPASQTVTVGANVTFSSTANGSPAPTYQWRKDGNAVTGATGASLTLTGVQLTQAGVYTVVATNSAGPATSNSATLTVNPPATVAPAFTTQPSAQTIGAGATVVFNGVATTATTYRWQKNGTDLTLAGATSQNLVLKNVTTADAGSYRVIATNSAGSTASSPANLTVNTVAATDLGRLVNLSILTNAGPGAKVLTVGAVVGPLNFSGSLPLVIRAVGPTLGLAPPAGFGIGGVLADPVLTINAAGVTAPIATNDNWGGSSTTAAAFKAVGAFDLPASSLDSAALPNAAAGAFTVQVTGKNNANGLVIAEIYDASSARTAASPRLINLSSLTQIDAGSSLAVGFVVRGATARTLLVRGVGPSLATIFGIGDVMADPKLELFNNDTGAKITENDNWGGDAQLMDAAASVGAFALADIATKDSVLLVTVAPGAYSARVSGVGTSAGTAIVEVYELP